MVITEIIKPKLAYEDYASLPDDERYELIDGELIAMPSPKEIHQAICGAIFMSVGMFANAMMMGRTYFAPFDVILSDFNVVQPDIIFVSNARSHIIGDYIHGAPDLVVEILSPSTADYDRTTKRELYERYGVPEYWMVDPYAKTITILRLDADGYTTHAAYGDGDALSSPTLAGFSMNVSELFQA